MDSYCAENKVCRICQEDKKKLFVNYDTSKWSSVSSRKLDVQDQLNGFPPCSQHRSALLCTSTVRVPRGHTDNSKKTKMKEVVFFIDRRMVSSVNFFDLYGSKDETFDTLDVNRSLRPFKTFLKSKTIFSSDKILLPYEMLNLSKQYNIKRLEMADFQNYYFRKHGYHADQNFDIYVALRLFECTLNIPSELMMSKLCKINTCGNIFDLGKYLNFDFASIYEDDASLSLNSLVKILLSVYRCSSQNNIYALADADFVLGVLIMDFDISFNSGTISKSHKNYARFRNALLSVSEIAHLFSCLTIFLNELAQFIPNSADFQLEFSRAIEVLFSENFTSKIFFVIQDGSIMPNNESSICRKFTIELNPFVSEFIDKESRSLFTFTCLKPAGTFIVKTVPYNVFVEDNKKKKYHNLISSSISTSTKYVKITFKTKHQTLAPKRTKVSYDQCFKNKYALKKPVVINITSLHMRMIPYSVTALKGLLEVTLYFKNHLNIDVLFLFLGRKSHIYVLDFQAFHLFIFRRRFLRKWTNRSSFSSMVNPLKNLELFASLLPNQKTPAIIFQFGDRSQVYSCPLAISVPGQNQTENCQGKVQSVVTTSSTQVQINDQELTSAMDWMRTIEPEVMINDDQLTAALQHLLISVEKGIERLEWNSVSRPWTHSSGSSQTSSFPRCCHASLSPVDTKDSSVQTSLQDDDDNVQSDDTKSSLPARSSLETKSAASFTTLPNENSNVSVCERNYIPNCESIATQTSTEFASTKIPDLRNPSNELMFALPPLAVREEDPDDGYCEHILTQPSTIGQVDPDMLHSQIALLPGCRDLTGRSIVIISTDAIRDSLQLSSCHLAQLLLYFHTIPKKEVVCKGFLVLIDASNPAEDFWNILDETFCLIEANLSNVISELIVLFQENEDILDASSLFPTSRIQCEIMCATDNKLLNFIAKSQLLCKYGGTYSYDHQEWISFRKFLEPFINGCRLSGRHLVSLLEELRGSRLPVSSTLTHQMIEQQKRNVTHTFHDEQLRHLEEEGDTILKELHSYMTRSPHNHDYRENLERTSVLYDELRKAMVKLARLADKRLNRLEECLQLKTFQEESSQVLSWLCRKGNESLEKHQAIADSLGAIKQQEEEFEKFYFLAMRQIEKGNDLLEEVSTLGHEAIPTRTQESSETAEDKVVQDLALSLKQHLGSFSEKLEGTRERIEDTAKCYQLMDKSYEWALDAMRFTSNMGIANTESLDGIIHQIRCLQDYTDNHLCVPEDAFSEMTEIASRLGNEKLVEQCKIVKLRCEETVDLIKARQVTLQKVKQQMEVDALRGPFWEAEDAAQTPRTMRSHSTPMNSWLPGGTSTPHTSGIANHQRRRSTGGPVGMCISSKRFGSPIGSYTSFPSSYYPSSKESYQIDSYIREREDQFLNHGLITEDLTSQGPIASISKTLLDHRMSHPDGRSSPCSSSSICKDLNNVLRSSGRSKSSETEGRTSKRLLKRCQMWHLQDDALEKAKAEVREQTALLRVERLQSSLENSSTCKSEVLDTPSNEKLDKKCVYDSRPDPVKGPVPVNTHLLNQSTSSDSTDQISLSETNSNDTEAKSKKTLMLIMKELIQTERDYVNSLEYIIENYIPELMREDIPQALRGQRNVVFGNIEKIYEFHNQYFLTELEHCESAPFTVGQCFLDFQPQFYLYALYNKNKPKSDALMSEYGNSFFRKKQLELQDKMDLASYLLKPVQRMGKYALLLKQLLKECPERETEHKALKAAEEMVRFQLRHGNDLLAMDALKDSDVNVKEQGRLLRQDEFIVWQGRSRKCMRHVFLFEDLILFSKARRDPQRKGYEMYQYKNSIKTTDIGMTEQIGDSPTKFEIWFRKRKLHDTFLLQAPNTEVKAAWVSELRKILVKQAVKNRENRLAEMSSMGIGNKPCLDIKPSEDQISDRSISLHQLARAPRFRNSIAVSPYDSRNNRNSIISVSSSSSSGSSQSSFSFYGTLNLGFEPGDSPRPLHRSLTQQSQCSTESGFCTDASTAGDSPENEPHRHKRAERTDSLLSNDSLSTNISPTDVPCPKFEQSLEENITTPM